MAESVPSRSSLVDYPPLAGARHTNHEEPYLSPVKVKYNAGAIGVGGAGIPKQKRWATPKTPIFAMNDQSFVSQTTGAETPAPTTGGGGGGSERQIDSSPFTGGVSGESIFSGGEDSFLDVGSSEDHPAAAAAAGDVAVAASPSKPLHTAPPARRLSAYLQERIDVFEHPPSEESTENTPHGSPLRRPIETHYALISPSAEVSLHTSPRQAAAIVQTEESLAAQLLSPIVNVHMQGDRPLHSLQSSPSGIEYDHGEFVDADVNAAASYFQGDPASQGRISFGAMPGSSDHTHASGSGFGSPDHFLGDVDDGASLNREEEEDNGDVVVDGEEYDEVVGDDGGSILAALNRPSFIGSDEVHDGHGIIDDSMQQEDESHLNASLIDRENHPLSPPRQTSNLHRQTPNGKTSVSQLATPVAHGASTSPASHGNDQPRRSTISESTQTLLLSPSTFSPSTYFASRSGPLGSIGPPESGVSTRRPTFRSPDTNLTGVGGVGEATHGVHSTNAADSILSPINVAQVLRERTPAGSRFTSPIQQQASPQTTAVGSASHQTIPNRISYGSVAGQTAQLPRSVTNTPQPASSTSGVGLDSSSRLSVPRSIPRSQLRLSAAGMSGGSPAYSSIAGSPSIGVSGTVGGAPARVGLFGGASPSPIRPRYDSSPVKSTPAPASSSSSTASVVSNSNGRLRTPLTPHEVDVLRKMVAKSDSDSATTTPLKERFNQTYHANTHVTLNHSLVSNQHVVSTHPLSPSKTTHPSSRLSLVGTNLLQLLEERLFFTSPYSTTSHGYSLTIQVSQRLQYVHRFILFEIGTNVDTLHLSNLIDAYLQHCYQIPPTTTTSSKHQSPSPSSSSTSTLHTWQHSPIIVSRKFQYKGSRTTCTLSCIIDVDATPPATLPSNAAASSSSSYLSPTLRTDGWMQHFLATIAPTCCTRTAPAAASFSSNEVSDINQPFEVRFMEERPIKWHQQLPARH